MNWGLHGKTPRKQLTTSAFYGHNKRAATIAFDVLYDFTMSDYAVQATGEVGLVSSISHSTDQLGFRSWRAFDGVTSYGTAGWFSYDVVPQWIQVNFNEPQLVRRLDMVGMEYGGYYAWMPKTFTIQGSNDGFGFTVLKSVSTTNWSANEWRSFLFRDNSTKYKHYRLHTTQTEMGGGQGVAIMEIRLYT